MVSGCFDGRLATDSIGCRWWWWDDEWYSNAKWPGAVTGAGCSVAVDGVDRAATNCWCDDTDNGNFDSLIVTWWCVRVGIVWCRGSDEWWLSVSGETSTWSGDDGDGICFEDIVSIIDLKIGNTRKCYTHIQINDLPIYI